MGPLRMHQAIPNPLPRLRWPTGNELLALRAWRLVRSSADNRLRLQSLTKGDLWEGPVFRASLKPEPECFAGVYAIKPSARPRHEFDWLSGRDTFIWGWVALSGQVIEHAKGYRAERAVIRQLRLGVQTHLRFPLYEDVLLVAQELSARYACPVKLGYWEPRKAFRVAHFMRLSGSEVLPLPVMAASPRPPIAPFTPISPALPVVPPARALRSRKTEPAGTSAHRLRSDKTGQGLQKGEQERGTGWRTILAPVTMLLWATFRAALFMCLKALIGFDN